MHSLRSSRNFLTLPKLTMFGGRGMCILCVKYDRSMFCRIYGEFTMETILATAFGYKVEILRGEVDGGDELIKTAREIFSAPPTGMGVGILTSLHCKSLKI